MGYTNKLVLTMQEIPSVIGNNQVMLCSNSYLSEIAWTNSWLKLHKRMYKTGYSKLLERSSESNQLQH